MAGKIGQIGPGSSVRCDQEQGAVRARTKGQAEVGIMGR